MINAEWLFFAISVPLIFWGIKRVIWWLGDF
jgi:hypothetical protein